MLAVEEALTTQRTPALNGAQSYLRKRWPECFTVVAFAAVVSYAIPFHEPWADEAQAWQLARSLSLPDLLLHHIRYEGSTGLWHLLLWVMIQLHVTYSGMHWICGAIAVAGTSVLVFRSPFPRYLKLALPFTNFLIFQYAVVARSYVLAIAMMFLIATWWKRRPAWIPVLLGVLANVSLHAAVISGGLAVIFYSEQLREWKWSNSSYRRALVQSSMAIAGLYGFALWTAWPPHDLLTSQLRVESPSVIGLAIKSLVWGIAQPFILAVPFWIGICVCLRARRSLRYLLPVLLFALFSGVVHFTWWHIGLLILLVITIVWITWPQGAGRLSPFESAGRYAMVFMTAIQILWSGYALHYDHYNAYSPDLAAAELLRPLIQKGATVAVTHLDTAPNDHDFQAVGILPYFDHNIYLNQPDSFWWWSANNPTEKLFVSVLRSRPAIIVVEVRDRGLLYPFPAQHPRVKLLVEAGYHPTNLFCGYMPAAFKLGLSDCHLIFQRTNPQP